MAHTAAWLAIMLAGPAPAGAQDIWMTRSAHISFFSGAPLEDIEAENKSVTCIFKPASGELAFKALMKSFRFERAAMQDHFNTQYLHTDEFPNATFSGKLVSAAPIDPAVEAGHEVTATGELTIHGVTRPVSHTGTVKVSGGKLELHAVFPVVLEDYNVKIPTNYVRNISREVAITVNAVLEPYER